MRITLLGTGTPTPSLDRMSSGYLVRTGGETMLFDLGPGAYHRMMQAGVAATEVGHMFFTHLHYDHCMDYARLVLNRWDQGAGTLSELEVYGPPPTARMTELLFGEDGVYGPDLAARTRHPMSIEVYRMRGGVGERARPAPVVREVADGDVVDGNGWRVRIAEVVHAQPQLTCLAYRLETEAGTFVYSGDTGPTPAMERLAAGADVLVHMCHYLTGTEPTPAFAASCMGHLELARLAESAGVKSVVLTHLTRQLQAPGVRERVIREMAAIYRGDLFFGEDLMEVPINGPAPVKLD